MSWWYFNISKVKWSYFFTHRAPRSLRTRSEMSMRIQDRIGIWKCWFLMRGENWSTRWKTSQSRVENEKQTQPAHRVRESKPEDIVGRWALSSLHPTDSPRNNFRLGHTVLCRSNASEFRWISWLFMAFRRNFPPNEISATFPRTFKAPIVLFLTHFRTIIHGGC